jgi:hypothetical protein
VCDACNKKFARAWVNSARSVFDQVPVEQK